MNDEDLNKLEALAKAATPGPWRVDNLRGLVAGAKAVISGSAECDGYFPHEDDGLFVAAANPAAILELIALARAGSKAPAEQQAEPVQYLKNVTADVLLALRNTGRNNLAFLLEGVVKAITTPADHDAIRDQAQPGECAWTLDDEENGIWQSSCGEAWSFVEGGPTENRVSFCHHCGKSVVPKSMECATDAKGQQ